MLVLWTVMVSEWIHVHIIHVYRVLTVNVNGWRVTCLTALFSARSVKCIVDKRTSIVLAQPNLTTVLIGQMASVKTDVRHNV